jgi:two-component system cell cycle sensor histidine kinase/response regulator CckA
MSNSVVSRILVIDDNPDIHADFRKILTPDLSLANKLGHAETAVFGGTNVPLHETQRFEIDSAGQGELGLACVTKALAEGRPYLVAFVDMRMPPGWDGIQTIKHLWAADPALQVVLCTAFSDHSSGEIAKALGLTDRLLILKKPFDNIEVLQLASALAEKWRLARQTETSLTVSESHYHLLFENSPTPIYVYDQATLRFLAVNESAVRQYGYSREEFLAMTLANIALAEEIPAFQEKLSKLGGDAGNAGIWRHRKKNGQLSEMEITSHPLIFAGQPAWLSLATDVTERLNLEAQLRQSQKMESVGQLARGIAHDFNNLLTVINGHAALLLASGDQAPKAAERLKEIAEAAMRAADLTRQLLNFSRKQVLQMQVIDLNEAVNQSEKMLRRILGADIALEMTLSPNLPCVKADLGLIEQALLNLAVNSRDAMPKGGRLSVQTSSAMIDKTAAQNNPEANAGRYVCLTFADTGCGIPPENLTRIFEPFFTTKELKRGTGLGLATVYGTVKQHQGWIEVSSKVNEGTAFKIFIPASAEKSSAAATTPTPAKPVIGGTETILAVEEEAPLLKLIQHILESHGYKVLGCSDGKSALQIWEEHRRKIDLLLTDMVLPDGMSGSELAGICQMSKPALRVIYINNPTPGKASAPSALMGPDNIQKPFHARKLAETVYECLTRKS